VDSTEKGAVSKLFSQLINASLEVFNANLRETSLAKGCCNFLHLNRDSRVLISEGNVIAANINKAESVAVILKVKV